MLQVAIEGTIGAGKSSLMQAVAARWPDRYGCIYEPIKQWTGHTNMLKSLYDDPKANAFTFEVGSLLHLSRDPSDLCWASPVTLMERSIFAAYYIFITCQCELGHIPDTHFALLKELFEVVTPRCQAFGIFHVQLDPETAFKRIQERGRPAETNISQDYVRQLCEKYDNLFIKQAEAFRIPIVTVDGKLPIPDLAEKLNEFTYTLAEDIKQDCAPPLCGKMTKTLDWARE